MRTPENPLVIEDKVGLSQIHVAKTVVRRGNEGFVISTSKSPHYPNETPDYETKLWKFQGYEFQDGNPVPLIVGDSIEGTDLDTEHQFPGQPEEALRYHNNIVEILAKALEASE